MKNIRILFMGTPEFAVTILQKIIQENYEVVGVVTAPDRPAGRGQKLKQSAVKQYALTQGLEVLQPTNLKADSFQEDLERLAPTVQVVVAFRMLPKCVWQFPKLGTFNLHASLLPQYRGAAPINWAIINGEAKTGVTTFFIDEKIDTGATILQREIEIEPDETAGELHDRLMHLGAETVAETIEQLKKGNLNPEIQKETQLLRTAYKFTRENTKVNWDNNLDDIYNFIRGLNPFPSAWCIFKNQGKELKCKLFKVSKEKVRVNHPFGSVIQDNKILKVALNGGYLIIDEIQLPGKRKMETKNLLNGLKISENASMG